MKHDLEPFFQQSLASSTIWTPEETGQVLQALAARWPGAHVDWEPDDEEWGRVVDATGAVVGLVCARIPAGFARNDLEGADLPSGVTWLRFESMNEPSYLVAPEILEEVFGRRVSRNVDYGSLSLEDLWWATVS